MILVNNLIIGYWEIGLLDGYSCTVGDLGGWKVGCMDCLVVGQFNDWMLDS